MRSRTASIYLAAATAVGAAGACGYALWPNGREATVVADSPAQSPWFGAAEAPLIRLLPTPSARDLELKWSPMGGLIPNKQPHSYTNVTITRARVPPPLNLELPAAIPRDTDLLSGRHALGSGMSTDPPAAADSLALTPNPAILDHGRHAGLVEGSHLFNRSNGLRGFMAQNWLSENVGLQGGLAIKEERLRQEGSNLRDNMAIGMGVLLAF